VLLVTDGLATVIAFGPYHSNSANGCSKLKVKLESSSKMGTPYTSITQKLGRFLTPPKHLNILVAIGTDLSEVLQGRDYLLYHNLSQYNISPEDNWQTSQATLRKGWVKDPEGKHRLWLPVEWRTDWDLADWHHDIATQFSFLEGRHTIIKF
jgi:hypothetical protein